MQEFDNADQADAEGAKSQNKKTDAHLCITPGAGNILKHKLAWKVNKYPVYLNSN